VPQRVQAPQRSRTKSLANSARPDLLRAPIPEEPFSFRSPYAFVSTPHLPNPDLEGILPIPTQRPTPALHPLDQPEHIGLAAGDDGHPSGMPSTLPPRTASLRNSQHERRDSDTSSDGIPDLTSDPLTDGPSPRSSTTSLESTLPFDRPPTRTLFPNPFPKSPDHRIAPSIMRADSFRSDFLLPHEKRALGRRENDAFAGVPPLLIESGEEGSPAYVSYGFRRQGESGHHTL